MKKTIFLIAVLSLLSILSVAASNIIISQVLYDPINSETYAEAIELYNPTNNTIDISNYIIKTASSEQDAKIPASTFMEPNSYFLLTDTNFDSYKDNPSWPSPDYQEAITLTNTNSGVAVIFNNQTLDAVGWGNASLINPELYETAPALPVPEGKSLTRINLTDTNNNLNDFSQTTPVFHNSTSTKSQSTNSSSQINVTITINNSAPNIAGYSFSEDVLARDGYQLLPEPAKNKTVLLQVAVSEKDGYSDISEIKCLFNSQQLAYTTTQINETAFNLTFTLSLPYYLEPKNYTINLTVKDNSNATSEQQIQFEYLPVLALDIDTSSLNFNEATNQILGDVLTSTKDKPTISNTGNTILNLGLSASNFTSANSVLPVSILSYGFNQTAYFPNTMNKDIQVSALGIAPAAKTPLSFKINLPESAVKGVYSAKVLVAGVSQ